MDHPIKVTLLFKSTNLFFYFSTIPTFMPSIEKYQYALLFIKISIHIPIFFKCLKIIVFFKEEKNSNQIFLKGNPRYYTNWCPNLTWDLILIKLGMGASSVMEVPIQYPCLISECYAPLGHRNPTQSPDQKPKTRERLRLQIQY